MNFNDNKEKQLKVLEQKIDVKIEKLEILISQLKSLFDRVETLEKEVKQFSTNGVVRKQSVVYLDKQKNIKILGEDSEQ